MATNALDALLSGGTAPPRGPQSAALPSAAPNALDRILGAKSAAAASPDPNALADPGRPLTRGRAGAESPLQHILSAFDVPGEELGAELRDVQQLGLGGYLKRALEPANMGTHPRDLKNVAAFHHALLQGGPEAAHDYYWTSPQELEAVRKGGGALGTIADAAEHHPFLTGAATFGGELLNPMNLATGEALGPAVGLARKVIPGVDPALSAVERGVGAATKPLRAVFDRFHGVGEAAGQPGRDWARAMDQAVRGTPASTAAGQMERIFGVGDTSDLAPAERIRAAHTAHLSQQQQTEIFRRAQRDASGQMVNAPRDVPEPKYGGSLDERADALYDLIGGPEWSAEYRDATKGLGRGLTDQLDKLVLERLRGGALPAAATLPRGLRERAPAVLAAIEHPWDRIGTLTDRQLRAAALDEPRTGYLPMKTYGGKPTYAFQPSQDDLSAPRFWTRSGLGNAASRKSKVFQGSLDDLEAKAAAEGQPFLHEEFDPAWQLFNYVRNAEKSIGSSEVLGGIHNEGGLGDVATKVGPARADLTYHLPGSRDTIVGTGPQGARTAENFAQRTARQQLWDQWAREIGRPDLVGGARTARTSAAYRTWREAQRAAKAAAKVVPGVQRGATAAVRAAESSPTVSAAAREIPAFLQPGKAQSASAFLGRLSKRLANNQQGVLRSVTRAAAGPERLAAEQDARQQALRAAYRSAQANDADRAIISRHVQRNLAQRAGEILDRMGGKVPEGYTEESKLGLGFGRDFSAGRAIQNDFAHLVGQAESAGALPEDARAFGEFFGTLNGLARRGMILVPTVHTVFNLGFGFLSVGGKPDEMAQVLAGRVGPDYLGKDLEERFMRSGAATSPLSFGSTERTVRNATTPLSEIRGHGSLAGVPVGQRVSDWVARAHTAADRALIGPDQRYVFDTVENGYARILFKRFTDEGMTDGEAAAKIRGTLGDYANINNKQWSPEWLIQKVAFFYPWAKTVIPYWTRQLFSQPGAWFHAPEAGIRTANELQGDTEPSTYPRSPWSLTVGREPNGDFRRLSLPMPQRYAQYFADALLGNGDQRANPIEQRTQPISDLVRGHLNPTASGIADTFFPGEASYQRLPYDRLAPPLTNAEALAGNVGQRFLPQAPVSPATRGDLLGAALGVSGVGFPSAHQSKAETSRQAEIRRLYGPAIKAARQRGDQAEANRLYLQMQGVLHQGR